MKNVLFVVAVLMLLCSSATYSQQNKIELPQVKEFANKYLEILMQNDSVLYYNTFTISPTIFAQAQRENINNKHTNSQDIELAKDTVGEYKRYLHAINKSWSKIQSDIQSDSIDISSLVLEDVNYEYMLIPHKSYVIFSNLSIQCISNNNKNVIIEFQTAIYYKNIIYPNAIRSIKEFPSKENTVPIKNSVENNPYTFAQDFVKHIKNLDANEYIKSYTPTLTDLSFFAELEKQDCIKYSREYNEEAVNKKLDMFIGSIEMQVKESYSKLESWIAADSIDVDKLNLYHLYFEYNSNSNLGMNKLDQVFFVFTYKETYYLIQMKQAIFFGNKVRGGEIKDIYEVNQFFESMK